MNTLLILALLTALDENGIGRGGITAEALDQPSNAVVATDRETGNIVQLNDREIGNRSRTQPSVAATGDFGDGGGTRINPIKGSVRAPVLSLKK